MRKSKRLLVKLVSLVILLSLLGAIMVSSFRVNHFVRTHILGQKDQVATAGTIAKNDAVTKEPVSAETIKNDPRYQITVGPDGNPNDKTPTQTAWVDPNGGGYYTGDGPFEIMDANGVHHWVDPVASGWTRTTYDAIKGQ